MALKVAVSPVALAVKLPTGVMLLTVEVNVVVDGPLAGGGESPRPPHAVSAAKTKPPAIKRQIILLSINKFLIGRNRMGLMCFLKKDQVGTELQPAYSRCWRSADL